MATAYVAAKINKDPAKVRLAVVNSLDLFRPTKVPVLEVWGYDGAKTIGSLAVNPTFGTQAALSSAQKKIGTHSIEFTPSGSVDPSQAFVSFPDNAAYTIGASAQFTIECWVRFKDLTDTAQTFCSHYQSNGELRSWLLGKNGGNLQFAFSLNGQSGGNLISILRAWTPVINTWYHLAVSRDASNDIRIFIDGVQQGAAVNDNRAFFNTTSVLYLGKQRSGGADDNPFYGFINYFRFHVGQCLYTTNFSPPTETYFDPDSFVDGIAKFSATGLEADKQHYCALEIDHRLRVRKHNDIAPFKTPNASSPASFKFAFAGDVRSGSRAEVVYDSIIAQEPLFFVHMGDRHYQNINTNTPSLFREAYDQVMENPAVRRLHRNVPVIYIWDDHDYGANDSFGTSPSHDAACEVYRERVPHLPLEEDALNTDPIYHSFKIGRIVFLVTDLRSEASDKAATDNGSKTMMGATQKTWFKGVLSDVANADCLFVWVCSRVVGGPTSVGADHWGGFTTERTELWDYIQTNCPGRVCILSADEHMLAIDDGTNHDFVTAGSEPIPCFQAAPLDQDLHTSYANGTYSEGRFDVDPGQFGVMDINDNGTNIVVTWTGHAADGTTLVTYQFTVTP